MMKELAELDCVPCRRDTPPLTREEIEPLLARLRGWTSVDDHHLHKRYALANFLHALDLVNRIGAVAEDQNHHPGLALGWGWVEVSLHTHKIDGLTENDFILAAKCDLAYRGEAP